VEKIMSIRLTYYLDKNKTHLKTFCERMNLKSYDELYSFCNIKNIKCDVTEEEYIALFPKEKKKKNEEKIIEKPKAKTRGRGRKSKPKTAGNSDSKNNS
jgi:hypothetical protein